MSELKSSSDPHLWLQLWLRSLSSHESKAADLDSAESAALLVATLAELSDEHQAIEVCHQALGISYEQVSVWISQWRRKESSEEHDALLKAMTVEFRRSEIQQRLHVWLSSTNIQTDGGAYVNGPVHANRDVVLRDQNNYCLTFGSVQQDRLPAADLPSSLIAASELMLAGAYSDAINLLDKFPESKRLDSQYCLLRALARLGEENPDDLLPGQLQLVETDLSQAVLTSDTRLGALAILGLIKHDAYLVNGLSTSPAFDKIAEQLEGRTREIPEDMLRLILNINSSNEARRRLGLV